MYDFIRISCCVPAIEVADVTGNCEKIEAQLRRAAKDGSTVAVFPELCLTGYTCQDLFFQNTLLEDCQAAIRHLAQVTEELDIIAIIGAPMRFRGQLYNCAWILGDGSIQGIVHKSSHSSMPNRVPSGSWNRPLGEIRTGQIASSESFIPNSVGETTQSPSPSILRSSAVENQRFS